MAGRTNRLSRFRGLRGGSLGNAALIAQRLGQIDYTSGGAYDTSTGVFVPLNPGTSPVSSAGGITPSEAALLSQAINVGGQIGVRAVSPTPMVTYNAATGQYTATGGAVLPSGVASSTFLASLSSYLPLILLGGGALLVVSMMGRR